MRLLAGAGLGVLATVFGLWGAICLGMAGLVWNHGAFGRTATWEVPESEIGIAMAIGSYIVWLFVLALSVWLYVRARLRGNKAIRVAVSIGGAVLTVVLSITAVTWLTVIALMPPDGYP